MIHIEPHHRQRTNHSVEQGCIGEIAINQRDTERIMASGKADAAGLYYEDIEPTFDNPYGYAYITVPNGMDIVAATPLFNDNCAVHVCADRLSQNSRELWCRNYFTGQNVSGKLKVRVWYARVSS